MPDPCVPVWGQKLSAKIWGWRQKGKDRHTFLWSLLTCICSISPVSACNQAIMCMYCSVFMILISFLSSGMMAPVLQPCFSVRSYKTKRTRRQVLNPDFSVWDFSDMFLHAGIKQWWMKGSAIYHTVQPEFLCIAAVLSQCHTPIYDYVLGQLWHKHSDKCEKEKDKRKQTWSLNPSGYTLNAQVKTDPLGKQCKQHQLKSI